MSKSANAGELRTPVTFKTISRATNKNAYSNSGEVNIFGEGKTVKVKWVNAHGYETTAAMQLGLREPATITMRYSPLINETLIVYRDKDIRPYEIISIDDVEQRHRWLEIKVQRKVPAR